jgi:hypothetical protein
VQFGTVRPHVSEQHAVSVFRIEDSAKQEISLFDPEDRDFSEEKSVAFYQTTLRHIPEDSALHGHRCENLKSAIALAASCVDPRAGLDDVEKRKILTLPGLELLLLRRPARSQSPG